VAVGEGLMLMITRPPIALRPSTSSSPYAAAARHVERAQPRIDGRLVLEYAEAGAGDRACPEQSDQVLLVDDLAARGVDEDRVRLQQLEGRAESRW
jgi:hypothetical protein